MIGHVNAAKNLQNTTAHIFNLQSCRHEFAWTCFSVRQRVEYYQQGSSCHSREVPTCLLQGTV